MRRVLALLTRLVSVLFAWLPFCGRRERLVGGAGKRVLVSGCDSGIGLRLAQRLHEAGYRVLAGCLSTDSEGARQLSKLRDRQHPVQVLQLDVTSDSSVQRALVQGRVHDEGRVVCLSTVVAAAPAMPCMSAYCASKTAVESFTRCLRLELARHGAHAIVVRPGDLAKHTGIMKRQGDDNEERHHQQLQPLSVSPRAIDIAAAPEAMSTGSASPLRNPLGTASPATPGTPNSGRPFCTLTDFGLKLVAHALQEGPDNNVCLSPFGVAVALGMAIVGSSDSTTAQVVHAVGAIDSNNLYRTCERILSMLNGAMPKTKVSLGNRLFVSDDIPLLPEFKETLAETFSVDLGRMNFKENPQAAAQEINAWAAKATDGNLTHLLRDGDVSENTRILMVSAIYFRGVFSEPFCGPVKAPFYVNARETAQVDMMESCRGALYCRSTRIPCEAIELSYVCRTLSLLIILPDKGVPLSKLVAALSNDVVRRLMKDLKPVQSMAVWMPRFRLQNSYSMVPALKAIGITHLFDDHVVDLSRMTGKSTGLAVDNFVHEALFETSEEGVGEATRPPEPLDASVITFRANRPFLYVLLHHYNHAVVFMGAVCRP
ncbi:serpin B9-like isoform X2 [Rhipicephalus microplus]|uniref:serpin B9-like isoform X2 n=1 Tax=Rhipicephalus microplus TaxID=6941 RepID=UPI003F6C32CE